LKEILTCGEKPVMEFAAAYNNITVGEELLILLYLEKVLTRNALL
jgi:hypothetical protein